jgi:uncharacterized protein YceK
MQIPFKMYAIMLTMIAIVSGCASTISQPAICAGTEQARTEHAAALADDGGPLSLVTGARLIQILDTGCANDT